MPRASELPEALTELAQLDAVAITDTRWDYDVRRLIDALDAVRST
jgi:hypothetical protein